MKEQEIAELRRMIAPHIGKRVSVTHNIQSGGHETVAARLTGVFGHGLIVGLESIPYEEIEELSLDVISRGEVSTTEDLVPE